MRISNQIISAQLATFAGAVLFCGATAIAQSAPGAPGAAPQPTQQPGVVQPAPGMNPTSQDQTSVTNSGQTTPEDKVFVEGALKGGMAEVQLGQLALQKSNNPEVKQFAQRMVDDHTKMGDQMKQIAQQVGVKVPDGPSKKDKQLMAKLQALNGDAFDKAYMKDMVKDHKNDLNDFKSEADNGSNPAVKNAASQGSQIISQHLQMAEQIDQKENTTAANGGMK
jgi:putative membrane protein